MNVLLSWNHMAQYQRFFFFEEKPPRGFKLSWERIKGRYKNMI